MGLEATGMKHGHKQLSEEAKLRGIPKAAKRSRSSLVTGEPAIVDQGSQGGTPETKETSTPHPGYLQYNHPCPLLRDTRAT